MIRGTLIRARRAAALAALALSVVAASPLQGEVTRIFVFDSPISRVEEHPSEFFPDLRLVDVGDTVRWEWRAGEHTVTSGDIEACEPDGRWSTPLGELTPIYERVFDEPGTFFYYCDEHCLLAMWGAVVVREPTPIESTTWGRVKRWFR